MNISKKKKAEFDDIFKLIYKDNFFIDIDLFRNLFDSDFYDNFLLYVDEKMNETIKTTDTIILHTNINSLLIQDTYYYDKLIRFANLLHKYTINIKKIIIYGSSILVDNIIRLINMALGINIYEKIFFSNDSTYNIDSNHNNNIIINKN
jgi:hypothetical protein